MDYKLPVKKQEETRKGFDGVKKNQYVTLAELQLGDTCGTTDTDSKTDTGGKHNYTKIYSKGK